MQLCSLWSGYLRSDGFDFSLVKNRYPFYPLVSQDAHEQDILPPVIQPDARSLSPFDYEPPERARRQYFNHQPINLASSWNSRLFINRDGPPITRKHGQRQPLQTDPSKRIIDDERRRFGPIPAIPKPRRKTDTVRPIAIFSFVDVDDDLAHELARVSTSDDGAKYGVLHLCAEPLFELRTTAAGCEFGCRHEGLNEGIVPEEYQVVKIGFGERAKQ